MGFLREKSRVVAVALGVALAAHSGAAEAKSPKSPKSATKECAELFDGFLREIDKDLVLVPYVRTALEKIRATVNVPGASEEALVDGIVRADARAATFQLEGIGEALELVDAVFYPQIGAKGEHLENRIGDYVLETELYDFVKQPAYAPLLTPNVEAMFKGRIAAERESLVREMRRHGWTGEKGKAYKEIFEWLGEAKPITKKSKLKKKLLKSMAEHLEEVHRKILEKELDPNDIEGGLHKMRRALRKIPILILSFDGMFYLDDALRIKGVAGKLPESARKNRFVPNEKDLTKRAVGISKDGYLYLGHLMNEFGRLKSIDGMKENVFRALKGGDLGSEAKPLLDAVDPEGASAASFRATRERGAALFREILETKILLQLAKQFRNAADAF